MRKRDDVCLHRNVLHHQGLMESVTETTSVMSWVMYDTYIFRTSFLPSVSLLLSNIICKLIQDKSTHPPTSISLCIIYPARFFPQILNQSQNFQCPYQKFKSVISKSPKQTEYTVIGFINIRWTPTFCVFYCWDDLRNHVYLHYWN